MHNITSALRLLELSGWRTLCARQRAPRLTLVDFKVDNISKYVCLIVIIYINQKSPNLSIFHFLMRNDNVIRVMSHLFDDNCIICEIN